MEGKNIAQGSFQEVLIEDGFYVLKIQNDTAETQHVVRDIDSSYIQFHFCLKGKARFVFNQGNYHLEVSEENSLLLYNTQIDLPMDLKLEPNSWLVSVVMTIRKFHSLFSKEADYIPFLSAENKDKKYYAQEGVSPAIAVILSQMMNYNLHPSIKELYIKGKVYELISLYFNKSDDADIEQCPFLVDEDNVRRIRKAKEIIIARMAEPPTLTELSEEIGLSLKKLKEGFKQIYGDSVFSFLFDYKMEYARKMLETGQHNVNEVGLKVGYSTASHFISAFKKKYGTTPKKYLMALANNG
ncbi:AraC family transcriptional regulator [Zobellia galactanivorans]|uniref:AraC-type transcriptional regulator n=1 Tax=Zobellia galactanivorans (strain DSM 12802 / CCUG 47099 / CIP 106680 / NCIMB 13871 / Dsij) TaxID=63186 RepID=G0L529_ZOBGA|nr:MULTISPECIES: AraC family transcriptional regulator [Zobellia]MBU3026581.1 AraC family transcriptional regulator [Zobellia galactanivorans]MDO6516278.1 AraC family transcriptional regulator [Zobellia uliginosa]MDO6809277.1 AraC family transcriptional regulator [Zobellia galactanivorans]OWW26921.1 AraC family transcriptional regulator [Zobellia sp. OII3]CAZ95917.1 AraC-type transcriptional regulator [Zobellia galactanivorans]